MARGALSGRTFPRLIGAFLCLFIEVAPVNAVSHADDKGLSSSAFLDVVAPTLLVEAAMTEQTTARTGCVALL